MGSTQTNKGMDLTQTLPVDCGLSRPHQCWRLSSEDTPGKVEFSIHWFHEVHTKLSDAKSTKCRHNTVRGPHLYGVHIRMPCLLSCVWKVLGPGLSDIILVCPCYGSIFL